MFYSFFFLCVSCMFIMALSFIIFLLCRAILYQTLMYVTTLFYEIHFNCLSSAQSKMNFFAIHGL